MAIEMNDSKVKVVKERELYMGLANVKVTAINPNKAQLHAMGIKLEDAPKYHGEDSDGNPYVIVRIYIEALKEDTGLESNFKTNLQLYLRPEHWLSKKGDKHQFIDKYGRTGWAPEGQGDRCDWLDRASIRKSYKGEETLINFLKAWANTSPEGMCSIDDIEELVKGNFSELQEYVVALEKNRIKLLLGVTIDQDTSKVYSRVYTRYFGRLTSSKYGFQDALNDDWGTFKAVYPKSLNLELYEGQGMEVEPDQEQGPSNPSTLFT